MSKPMASSGHNSINETFIGQSGSVDLKFFDSNGKTINVKNSKKPINIYINKNDKLLNSSFTYVNVSSLKIKNESLFLFNAFSISSNNASVHIEIKPLNSTSYGYMVVLKFGQTPRINSTFADYDFYKFLCQSKFN